MTLTTQDFINSDKKYGAQHYHPLDVVLEKGEGVWLTDVEGNRYIDMMSAYSAVNLGHCHSEIVETLKKQASQLMLCSRAFHNNKMAELLVKLCDLTGLDKALLMNTGVEAVETAIKAARRWGYHVKGIIENKAEIIVINNNFHGRTLTVISFSSDDEYKRGFGPLTPGFKSVQFDDIPSLEAAISKHTCAILLEPIQGEGGVMVPSSNWLNNVADLCRQNNILLIVDEIQTGLGRTGKIFACEWFNVKPDAYILGKALGGGAYPVSAFVARKDVMGVFNAGSHGSTFSGNPLGAAVAIKALDILCDQKLLNHVQKMGELFMKRLLSIRHNRTIRTIRGKGLFMGIELEPGKIQSKTLVKEMMKCGVLTKDTYSRITNAEVIRLAPPLIITEEELHTACDCIELAFKKCVVTY